MRYQNGDISIDDSFARFGSKAYAIDKINTVDIQSRATGSGCLGLIMGLAGAFCLLMGVAGFNVPNGRGMGIAFVVIGAVLLFLAWRSYRAAKVQIHRVMLTTSSAEVQATESSDRDEIDKIRSAIEGAMAKI